jgi:enolase-phosphatase E1
MTIRCVLMDIEGTIVPIAFVREVLFPYAQQRMAAFLRERREDPAVCRWTALCQDTVVQDGGVRPDYDELPNILHRWMEQDRKHTGLKGLQGMIWEEGYRTGAFAPALYDDVYSSLMAWQGKGLRLALYSSGSEQAQRLLIAHTTEGDLTSLFTHYFDTRVGSKTDPESYRRIAQLLALPAEVILFLSDVEAELDAAADAGLGTRQIVRPGTQAGSRHPILSNFRDLRLSNLAQPTPCP